MTRGLMMAAVLFAAVAGRAADRREAATDLFPHRKGSAWEYRVTRDGKASDFGVSVAAATADTSQPTVTFRCGYEYLGFAEQMTVTPDGVSFPEDERRGDKLPQFIPAAIKAGDRWDSLLPSGCGGFTAATAVAGEAEEVTVPAGKFKAVKVVYAAKLRRGEITATVWFASGVGVVKHVYKSDAFTMVIELKKFVPGK